MDTENIVDVNKADAIFIPSDIQGDKTDYTEQFKKNGILDVREVLPGMTSSEIIEWLMRKCVNTASGQWLRCCCEGNNDAGVLIWTKKNALGDTNKYVTVTINGKTSKLGIADPWLRLCLERETFWKLSINAYILKQENPGMFALWKKANTNA